MTGFVWEATRGYRLALWRSPYLRWRIETYWGSQDGPMGWQEFLLFSWRHRAELIRFLRWAARMRAL